MVVYPFIFFSLVCFWFLNNQAQYFKVFISLLISQAQAWYIFLLHFPVKCIYNFAHDQHCCLDSSFKGSLLGQVKEGCFKAQGQTLWSKAGIHLTQCLLTKSCHLTQINCWVSHTVSDRYGSFKRSFCIQNGDIKLML